MPQRLAAPCCHLLYLQRMHPSALCVSHSLCHTPPAALSSSLPYPLPLPALETATLKNVLLVRADHGEYMQALSSSFPNSACCSLFFIALPSASSCLSNELSLLASGSSLNLELAYSGNPRGGFEFTQKLCCSSVQHALKHESSASMNGAHNASTAS